MLTVRAAQMLQDTALTSGRLIIWVVTDNHPIYPRRIAACAKAADMRGNVEVLGCLVADTLLELRLKLPRGLVVRKRDPFDRVGILETWEPF